MDIVHAISTWVSDVLGITFAYTFILTGPGIILAVVLHYIHKLLSINACASMGRTRYLLLFGGIGTMIHEMGHAIMCFPFGHKITSIRLFRPDPETGMLGYVKHTYNPKNPWAVIGNFFIGIGPLILGSIIVCFSARFLISEDFFAPFARLNIAANDFTSLDSLQALLSETKNATSQLSLQLFVAENLTRWQFWSFVYVLIAVGGNMSLSPSDIRGAAQGFAAIFGVFLLIGLVTKTFGGSPDDRWLMSMAENYSFLYAIMLLSILFNSVLIVPFFLFRVVLRR